jgi:hypothetical protein
MIKKHKKNLESIFSKPSFQKTKSSNEKVAYIRGTPSNQIYVLSNIAKVSLINCILEEYYIGSLISFGYVTKTLTFKIIF